MAINVVLENWVYTERKIPVQNATIVIRRSDTGAQVDTTITDALGHWGPRTVDIQPWGAGVFPDVEVQFNSQTRIDKGGAQVFFGNAQFATTTTLLGAWNFSAATVTLADPKVTGQTYKGTAVQTLGAVATNTGVWRYFKAFGGSLTINGPLNTMVNPGATAVGSTYTSPNGESTGWYCDGTTWTCY